MAGSLLADGLKACVAHTMWQSRPYNRQLSSPTTLVLRRGTSVPAEVAAEAETTHIGTLEEGHPDGLTTMIGTTTSMMNPPGLTEDDHLTGLRDFPAADRLVDHRGEDHPTAIPVCGPCLFETCRAQKEKKPTRLVSYRCPPLQVSDRGRLHSATKWLELRATPTKDSSGSRRSNSQVQTWHICTTAHLSTPWMRSLPRRSPRL